MEFGDYQFAQPFFALLAILIPIGLWIARRRVERGTLRFSTLAPFRRIRPSWRVRLCWLVPALRVLALLAMIAALMRPQKGTERSPEKSRGIGIMLAADNSGSMRQDDFEIDGRPAMRIDAVKKVARDFIKGGNGLPGRPNDEIGIVSFTGYPVPRAPFTLDHGAVLEVLDSIQASDSRKAEQDQYGNVLNIEEFRTALGDGLALAANRLKNAEVKSKVIILLTDGSQNYGVLSPEEGAKIAAAYGIKVYTIGIGKAGVVMVTVEDPFIGTRKVPRRSDLDEDTLRMIAAATGGKYYNAATTGALRQVYEEIDQLERSEIKTSGFHSWDERFQPLALAAALLIVLEVILSQTVFRRIP